MLDEARAVLPDAQTLFDREDKIRKMPPEYHRMPDLPRLSITPSSTWVKLPWPDISPTVKTILGPRFHAEVADRLSAHTAVPAAFRQET